MRFVVVGAGAIGGVVGGHLARADHDVAFVARGEHGARIAADGLRVRTPSGEFTVRTPVATAPAELGVGPDDIVLLAVKGQDTAQALDALVDADAAPTTPVACLQNGVGNEAQAAERFDRVYGVPVMAPTLHLEPGIVEAKAGPVPAILDIGCYPDGVDDTARSVAAAFEAAGMVSEARPDIMRWKWAKLLLNLTNAVQAVCGPAAAMSEVGRAVHREGRAVLDAAGIDFASGEEDRARRGDILRWTPTPDVGGSSWQSLARGGTVETDHLTGEIVRLGKVVGVPTPVNTVLLARSQALARERAGPGAVPVEVILAEAATP
ncbi:2-dehydropantoate 2-reductase N-terminal domain-containing protein [soil metagenome]